MDNIIKNTNINEVKKGNKIYKVRHPNLLERAEIRSGLERLPIHLRKVLIDKLVDVKISDEFPNSFFKGNENIICLKEGFSEREFIHEAFHFLAKEIDIYHNPKYKQWIDTMIANASGFKETHTSDNVSYSYIEFQGMIKKYQGRIYFKHNGIDFATQLPEIISVAMEYYYYESDIAQNKELLEILVEVFGIYDK